MLLRFKVFYLVVKIKILSNKYPFFKDDYSTGNIFAYSMVMLTIFTL
jgi:hypothetical protein